MCAVIFPPSNLNFCCCFVNSFVGGNGGGSFKRFAEVYLSTSRPFKVDLIVNASEFFWQAAHEK